MTLQRKSMEIQPLLRHQKTLMNGFLNRFFHMDALMIVVKCKLHFLKGKHFIPCTMSQVFSLVFYNDKVGKIWKFSSETFRRYYLVLGTLTCLIVAHVHLFFFKKKSVLCELIRHCAFINLRKISQPVRFFTL